MGKPRLLEGQSVVVFGGSSGLGRAVAIAFAEHGAQTVVVADLQEEPREGGLATRDAIASVDKNVRFTFVPCDIRVPEQVDGVFTHAEELAPTDVVANTAAVYWRSSLLDTDISAFDNLMAVNVRGALLVAQAAARHMLPRHQGMIINTGSGAGWRGGAEFSAYCASKGALRLLTQSLAAELGPHGVRVNEVDPAYIDTAMTRADVPVVGQEREKELVDEQLPLRRASSVEEVADAYVYLASPLASYINGHCLPVDGGLFTSAPNSSVTATDLDKM